MSKDDIKEAMELVLETNSAVINEVALQAAEKASVKAVESAIDEINDRFKAYNDQQQLQMNHDRELFKSEMENVRNNMFELATGYQWDDRKAVVDGISFAISAKKWWLLGTGTLIAASIGHLFLLYG